MKSARQKECDINDSLFAVNIPVWYESSGKVSSEWLSACKEQRHQTKDLMEKIAEPLNLEEACTQVVRNAGKGGVDANASRRIKKMATRELADITR